MSAIDTPELATKKYRITDKFNHWLELMIDKSKPTFGNATQSALIAYSLDPDDPGQYHSATNIGSKNKQKVGDLALLILYKKGVTFGKLLDIALAKMSQSNSPVWWLIIWEMMGYGKLFSLPKRKRFMSVTPQAKIADF